tara:strand:+ start:172 stop:1011 length:840 start_codon:yes stop_codon:yes gene_type:complete
MNNTTSDTETVETVEENVETNEAEEVETADTDDSVDVGEEELMTIEELLGLNEDDYDEFTEDANHKGMKPLHEWMQHIPEDVRKHVANIRSSYTQKTQELSEMRKALDSERSELMRQQDHAVNNPFLKRAEEELVTDEEYDLYTPEGMQKEIKRQAAQMLQEMMKPAQEEMQIKQRRIQLEQFKTDNPDLMDDQYRLSVAQMLQERPELRLEDAFYIVKSKVDSQKLKVEREQVAKQRSTRRETLRKTSGGKSVTPKGTPQFRDAWQAFQYHKSLNSKK